MARKAKIDYAELCDVLRIKINAARSVKAAEPKRGTFFSEPVVGVADMGSHIGDPRAAQQRRTAELQGACEWGTVKVPVKGDKGRTKLTEVPATEENVRKTLDYWRTRGFRAPKADASPDAFDRYANRQTQQSEMVSSLVRRLDAMRKAEVIQHAEVNAPVTTQVATVHAPTQTTMGAAQSPEGLVSPVTGRTSTGMLTGPALVQGPNMAPVQRMWRNPVTGVSEPAAARLDGALTERLDRTVADERPKAHRSASQRNNWRKKQRRLNAKND